MLFNRKTIEVYWATPMEDKKTNWNILYEDPISLSKSLLKNITKNIDPKHNVFLCPAFRNLSDNTFIIRNPIESEFKFLNDDKFEPMSKQYLNSEIIRKPILKGSRMLQYNLPYIFFSEEDINVTLTSPYFSEAAHLKYGNVVPGKFNISKWFRPLQLEYCVRDGEYIKFEEKEHLAYVNFDIECQVVLKRFNLTNEISKISWACTNSTSWENKVPLLKRYKRFKESNTKKLLLKLIRQNLYD